MRRGRKPWAVWDDRWFRTLWYDRRITIAEMARRLGRRATRPLLAHARALDLPARRDLEGPVGRRGGRRRRRTEATVRIAAPAPAPVLTARFACERCGQRSATPVHETCAQRAPVVTP